jgi:hypothetical protein
VSSLQSSGRPLSRRFWKEAAKNRPEIRLAPSSR